jgi:L-fuconate dehydratase
MTPQQLVRCVDFRYITDAITPDEAIEMLQRLAPAKPERIERMVREGFPAYTTSAGWLGYSDEKLRELCRKGLSQGWRHFKMKVGRDLDDDLRRAEIISSENRR